MKYLGSITDFKKLNKRNSTIQTSDLSFDWIVNGALLIKGLPARDGNRRLYVVRISDVTEESRTRKNQTNGIPARMVSLVKKVYIVVMSKSGQLVAREIDASKDVMTKVVGLNTFRVTLNDNKTPLWSKSIGMHIQPFLNQYREEILDIKDVFIPQV